MDTGWVNILFAKSLAIGDILSWFSFISYSVYCIKKLWNKYFLNITNTLKVITYSFIYQESNASIISFKINRLLIKKIAQSYSIYFCNIFMLITDPL